MSACTAKGERKAAKPAKTNLGICFARFASLAFLGYHTRHALVRTIGAFALHENAF